ncbi:hypothetical protein ABZ990_15340 [Streptomyces sp. NPDC046203]
MAEILPRRPPAPDRLAPMDFTIRTARPEDYERLGEITVRA